MYRNGMHIAVINETFEARDGGYQLASETRAIGLFALVGLGMFPALVHAWEPARQLTIYNASSSPKTLWIMLVMGVVGYLLRKFDFDPAPLVLGLVIAERLLGLLVLDQLQRHEVPGAAHVAHRLRRSWRGIDSPADTALRSEERSAPLSIAAIMAR